MRSTIKKYLCSPIDNPEVLDGYMNTEYVIIYDSGPNYPDPCFYMDLVRSRFKRNKGRSFGLLYDRFIFKKDKKCLGYWFRNAEWSNTYTPLEAYIKYLAPYK